ncbi:MAG: hypothetical protein IT337_03035, partial [Thermomicrobiales bacterium]|nr:hypothetical protein [Thermomicrobiales bacterium]
MAFGGYRAGAFLAVAALAFAGPAIAQTAPAALAIVPGTHVTQLSAAVFVAASCSGGDGAVLERLPLRDFVTCAVDQHGLATIAFRHDDTAELEALARGNPGLAAREATNRIGGNPATFSLRVDTGGRIAAIVATLPATAEAFAVVRGAMAAAWTCTGPDAPAPSSRCTADGAGRLLVIDWPVEAAAVTLTVSAADPANPPAAALGLDQPQPDLRPGPPYSG